MRSRPSSSLAIRFGVAFGVLSALPSTGCFRAQEHGDFEEIGLKMSSTELPPGLYPPVSESDLPAVTERGQLVYAMERALKLAYEDALFKAGDPHALAVLPLVQIDPGGNSGEVVFIRWPTPPGGTPPPLTPEHAERWLLASLKLNPDAVLDVELLKGKIEDKSHDARRITSLINAAEALRDKAPGALFHLLDVYEVVPSEKKGKQNKTVAHIYALSADGDGPDLEVVIDEVVKKKTPAVLSVHETHATGNGVANPIVTNAKTPGSLTVTRAMLKGPEVGAVGVKTADGQQWSVDSATGEITRPGGATP